MRMEDELIGGKGYGTKNIDGALFVCKERSKP
jgi:hypothetical protein